MKFYSLILISLVLFSCKKKEVIDTIENIDLPVIPIFNLSSTVGNYWVYDWYEVDALGNSTNLSIKDSVYVIGTTTINGNDYVHYGGTYMGNPQEMYLRDSSKFIVSSTGQIMFNRDNFTDTLAYTEDVPNNMKSYWIARKTSSQLVVPQGSFNVYDYQGHYYTFDGTPFTACDSSWIQHNYYDQSEGFEILSQRAVFSTLQSSCTYRERRLVRGYW